eukprot:symbB.v1.2.042722.t1/scaffold10833.1/size1476/1
MIVDLQMVLASSALDSIVFLLRPVAQQLIAYTRGCLDALRITNGATHTEVMMTETGP